MNNISEQIAFFFSFWIIPLCILPKVGLLGHLKDENNLAQKDVMTLPGEYSLIFNRGKIVGNSRFRCFTRRIGQFLYYFYQCGGFRGSTYSKHVTPHVETRILIFNLTDSLLMLTRT